uniref:Serine and arginine rich splicing factor 7 n=1 Tax=Anser brachyrhynchus TaxID=132585 RepID=A0A8B9CF10_9AVES
MSTAPLPQPHRISVGERELLLRAAATGGAFPPQPHKDAAGGSGRCHSGSPSRPGPGSPRPLFPLRRQPAPAPRACAPPPEGGRRAAKAGACARGAAAGGAVRMSRYGRYGGETKVYVGNLGTGAGKGELERAFSYYGPLRTVWIARNPPGFAFVEFEDPRDAEDAVRGLDGKVICGSRVRVEVSTGMPRRSRYDRPPARRPFDPNDRCYECGEKGHYAYDCHRYSRRRRSRFLRLSQSP